MPSREHVETALELAYEQNDLAAITTLTTALRQYEPEGNTGLESFSRGMMDMGQGAKQLYLRGTDPEAAKAYESGVNQQIAEYEQGEGSGIDWGRIGGNVAAAAPLMLIPGGKSVVARTALGTLAGSLGGLLNYTPTDDGEFWPKKGIQTAIGAGTGGIAPNVAGPVVSAASRATVGAGNLGRRVVNSLPMARQKHVDSALIEAVGRRGAKWDDLSEGVRNRLLDDVGEQLDTTGNFNAEAAARKINFEELGFTGEAGATTGQITRDPKLWTFEKNAAKLDEIGDPLTQKYMAQQRQINQNAQNLANQLGPDVSEYGAGELVERASTAIARGSQRQVGEGYDQAARAFGPDDLIVNPDGLSTRLTAAYDEAPEVIPSGIRKDVEKLVNGDLRPNVENVHKAVKRINRWSAVDDNQGRILGNLRTSLNGALDETAEIGGKGAEQLRAASRLAAKRFNMIDGGSRRRLVDSLNTGKVRTDKFIQNKVINGDIDELDNLRRYLVNFDEEFTDIPRSEGQAAWNAIRSSVMRNLNRKAGYTDDASQNFSGQRWLKEIEKLGDRRDILFTADENILIDKMAQAARDLTYDPPFSAVNYSNTTPTLMNMLGKISKVPILGQTADILIGMARTGKNALEAGAKQAAVKRSIEGMYTNTAPQRSAALAESLMGPMQGLLMPIGAPAAQVSQGLLSQ